MHNVLAKFFGANDLTIVPTLPSDALIRCASDVMLVVLHRSAYTVTYVVT